MCPDGAVRLTCAEYWNAGLCLLRCGSCPTTPRPRTVSRLPSTAKIFQWRSRSCTESSPRFSSRMQYRHCAKKMQVITSGINHQSGNGCYPVNVRVSVDCKSLIVNSGQAAMEATGRLVEKTRKSASYIASLSQLLRLGKGKRITRTHFNTKLSRKTAVKKLFACLQTPPFMHVKQNRSG